MWDMQVKKRCSRPAHKRFSRGNLSHILSLCNFRDREIVIGFVIFVVVMMRIEWVIFLWVICNNREQDREYLGFYENYCLWIILLGNGRKAGEDDRKCLNSTWYCPFTLLASVSVINESNKQALYSNLLCCYSWFPTLNWNASILEFALVQSQ